jgi:hypothetical protein
MNGKLNEKLGPFEPRWRRSAEFKSPPGIVLKATPLILGVIGLSWIGCDGGALNPSFVGLFDPAVVGDVSTLENPTGHVIVAMINNAEVDERLLDYMESAEGGSLMLTDLEKRLLRPRIRFRVGITFTDGQTATVEFINGSRYLVQPTFDSQSEPDLNQNDLRDVVVTCDVASVQVLDPIEVFVPVEVTRFQFVEPSGVTPGFFREAGRIPPGFQSLEVDTVDQDLNTIVRRNIGIRDRPSTVENPRCGSVIGILLDGVLSVPFREDLGGVPGFEVADIPSAASVGGRYEFRVTIQ